MSMQSLQDLFFEQLKDIYDAEHRIIKALPKMAREASSSELTTAFEEHERQTQKHIQRLEKVFGEIGKKPTRKKCVGMMGLLTEGKEIMEEEGEEPVIDAGLIAAAQKVEHYEMAGYGCLISWARTLGHDGAAKVLQQTLDEEKQTDEKLSVIAKELNGESIH